jgi:HD-GYP domain-containing protein (c-di-GMP phosphodiesterase class II)
MSEGQNDSRGEARQSFYAKQHLIESARTAFQLLSAVIKSATLYPEAHPSLLASADKFRKKIEELLASRKEVAFYFVGGELFFETLSVLIDQSLSLLMEQFSARDIGGIVFRPGLKSQELIKLAGLMNKDSEFLTGQADANDVIMKQGIMHIELHRVLLVDKDTGSAIKEGKKKASEIYKEALDAVKGMVQAVQRDEASNLRKMNTMVQGMVDYIMDNRDALMGLTCIKMYDEYTFSHSVNTSILAVSLGSYLSFEKREIAALGIAGLMHDIGKVNVPHEVINKPGKLTFEEWEQVRRHPVEGALLLAEVPGLSKLATVAAFEHHQHGGQGYPRVEGEIKVHPFSQIVSLADAYEALTAARVYYSAQMPVDQAIRILLAKRGPIFNPVLVKAFVNMIGIFPVGTILKLDTGEVGLVKHQTRDLLRPRVLLLTKFDGSEKENGVETSLLETVGGRYKRTMTGIINAHEMKINIKKYLE